MSQATTGGQVKPISQVVIPARLASSRLPRKLLLRETGKTLIQHTYEAACRARRPRGVLIATDHEEILREVRAFGGDVQLTGADLQSGTDRVAEVARLLDGVDVIVNVQGDEPELSGEAIDHVIELLEQSPGAVMSTLATPIRSRRVLDDPSCVKVVFNAHGNALYFSRSPIPAVRQWSDDLLAAEPPRFFLHLGIYAYRREFLLQLAELPPSPLERLECLEQLRVLEAGYEIAVGVIDEPVVGIDTPQDYQEFVARHRAPSQTLPSIPMTTLLDTPAAPAGGETDAPV